MNWDSPDLKPVENICAICKNRLLPITNELHNYGEANHGDNSCVVQGQKYYKWLQKNEGGGGYDQLCPNADEES